MNGWHESMSGVPAAEWDRLAAGRALVSSSWLVALEDTGCVGDRTGWQPMPLTVGQDGIVAAAPAYIKQHSYGEYVFDWAWAEAWERAGGHYYPKLVVAVPFTPVCGPRLMGDTALRGGVIHALEQQVVDTGLSSAHVLFPGQDEVGALEEAGWLIRHGVQFHWIQRGYRDFGDFLAVLDRDKRKKIRQERRRVGEAGITIRTLEGSEIGAGDWRLFYQCYRQTYLERRSTPYLSLAFFEQVGETLADHMVMFIASKDGRDIAASLCLRDGERLYGRYWGAVESVPCLHFEMCYYQGIEYAIKHGLTCFEGGAQGEHKLARGFDPVRTYSGHYLRDSRFRSAVYAWLQREQSGIDRYVAELFSHSAYKNACHDP
ncbi:GNAT family N-acetyltransferase [Paludibacterium paludis]|uniref:GNAT family N-acetyltransferase n=1 Tax=Paludibacterium paludis TaxID=1225769 RepID=UPI001FD01D42|nr:GNAT family N-acetyltransferase [Paludibacterium paludis]